MVEIILFYGYLRLRSTHNILVYLTFYAQNVPSFVGRYKTLSLVIFWPTEKQMVKTTNVMVNLTNDKMVNLKVKDIKP